MRNASLFSLIFLASVLAAPSFSWAKIEEVRSSGDSLIYELNLDIDVREYGEVSRIICAECDRDADGGLWYRLPVELFQQRTPGYAITPLSQRRLKPQGAWLAQRDSALKQTGEEIPRTTHWGKVIQSNGAWQATLSILIARPAVKREEILVPDRIRIAIHNATSINSVRSTKKRVPAVRPAPATTRQEVEWLARISIGDDDHSTFHEDGIYLVTYEMLRTALASSGRANLADGLPVSRIALFTGPADTLPLIAREAPQPSRLQEVAIELFDHGRSDGGADGLFGPGDTLLFFGHGSSRWSPAGADSVGRPIWRFSQSPWSLTHDYYIALLGSGSAKRLQSRSWSGSAGKITTSHHYVRAEKDLMVRLIDETSRADDSSGIDWFWLASKSDAPSQYGKVDLAHPELTELEGLVDGSEVSIVLSFLPYTFRSSAGALSKKLWEVKHQLSIAGVTLDSIGWRDGSDAWYRAVGLPRRNIPWDLTLHPYSGDFGRLDGITLRWERRPQYLGSPFRILHDRPFGLYQRSIKGTKGCRIVKVVNGEATSILPISSEAFIDSVKQADVSYWVDCPDHRRAVQEVLPLLPPMSPHTVADLERGRSLDGDALSPVLLVIAPGAWESFADEYSRFRSSESIAPASVAIVRAEDIYREYSAGQFSPVAIRDYLRWAKKLWPKLEAVLLLGDGHYDYRGKDERAGNNVLPLFEYQHLASDDYYAALDSSEWIIRQRYGLDLAVGRIPAQNLDDLKGWFQKLKLYEGKGKLDLGVWHNRNLFVADDFLAGGGVLDPTGHTTQLEEVARAADVLFPLSENQRLMLANYRLDALGEKGEASNDWIEAINAGRWLMVYFGHGGAHQIADENLFDISRVPRLSNASKPTFFGFFSCLLGRFDRPKENSLSEELLFSGQGGALGIIAPTRETFPSTNQALTKQWMNALSSEAGTQRLGDVLRRAKNVLLSGSYGSIDNTQKYHWLGDPMTPRFGWKASVLLDSVPDTLSALQRVRLTGSVKGMHSGELFIQVEEQERMVDYVDTLRPAHSPPVVKEWSVHEKGRIIFGSREKVEGGRFSLEFVSPRKMSFGDSNGVIRSYAWSTEQGVRGGAVDDGITIYGTSTDLASLQDTLPPEIQAWLCDQAPNATGYLSSPLSLSLPACLTIQISDSTGVDQSTLPDEGVTWELVGITPQRHPTFVEQSGKQVQFRLLLDQYRTSGEHLLRVRAQDVIGNVAEKEWRIELNEKSTGKLFDVVSIPNPMKTKTVFHFKLSPGTATVSIKIYSIDGRLLRTLSNVISGVTSWDGRDQWGNRLANGLYYYQVEASYREHDVTTGKVKIRRETKLQKLLISR